MKTKLIKTASGMEVDVKEFVKKWMDSHEPDTFVRNAFGVPIYTAGYSSINLESFFEILLSDFISDNPNQQPTLLTEDKEGEGQGDLWDELFDHIENTPVDVPWADCIKELKQKFKITKK